MDQNIPRNMNTKTGKYQIFKNPEKQAANIKLDISNLDSFCKTERGFCQWVSYKQKNIFVF